MEMDEKDYKTSELPEIVEYNLSSFKIGWIAQLIQRADLNYLRGFIDKAFFCWKCVYGQISNRITSEEDKNCRTLEKKFFKVLKSQNIAPKAYFYEKYHRTLQALLKKYGFDMREKETDEHLV